MDDLSFLLGVRIKPVTFSAISLLNQAGRPPLVSVQRKAGWAIGDALKIAFTIMREEGGKYKGREGSAYAEIKAADIPQNIEVEVSLDASLLQDKLQMANIFNILQGKIPQEWLMENVLNIRQPNEVMKQLMTEQATQMHFAMYLQQQQMQAQQAQQMQQMAMQQQMQGNAPVPGLPGGAQGMIPGGGPETMAQPPGGFTETMSNPMQGGIPPEMMAGGGQGPRGPVGTEEEGMYAGEFE